MLNNAARLGLRVPLCHFTQLGSYPVCRRANPSLQVTDCPNDNINVINFSVETEQIKEARAFLFLSFTRIGGHPQTEWSHKVGGEKYLYLWLTDNTTQSPESISDFPFVTSWRLHLYQTQINFLQRHPCPPPGRYKGYKIQAQYSPLTCRKVVGELSM